MTNNELYQEVIRRYKTDSRRKIAEDLDLKFSTVKRWIQRHNKNQEAGAPQQGGLRPHYHGIPPSEANEMRKRKKEGWTAKQIMEHFGRSRASVYEIVRGIADRRYRHGFYAMQRRVRLR